MAPKLSVRVPVPLDWKSFDVMATSFVFNVPLLKYTELVVVKLPYIVQLPPTPSNCTGVAPKLTPPVLKVLPPAVPFIRMKAVPPALLNVLVDRNPKFPNISVLLNIV